MDFHTDHYATLGLDRFCTTQQVRTAFRLLAKRFHPDVNSGSVETAGRFRDINLAHEVLSDPARRRAYDRELAAEEKGPPVAAPSRGQRVIKQDVRLRLEDFLRGAEVRVQVKDPANGGEVESYELSVPPDTPPGARFRIPRAAPFEGNFVEVRVRPMPGGRLKPKGSDLKCDLRIPAKCAINGGTERVSGLGGRQVTVGIPRGVPRGTILCIPSEGLPKPHGGRGNLLVRITFRAEVRAFRR